MLDLLLSSHGICLFMFVSAFGLMIFGFPVAFTLAGTGIAFAALGSALGVFPWPMLATTNGRIVALLLNETLLAVPLFVFMGVVLERSKIAENLLLTMGQLFGGLRGGLGISVVLVGALLAASTGIVGATVVTMGLISLPAMLKANYDKPLAAGVICASGTLAQLIPPSTVLILLGMTLQNADTQANLRLGRFGGATISITDLFSAALLPGLVMVLLYIGWLLFKAATDPASCPALVMSAEERRTLGTRVLKAMLPPLLLIVVVLGSILGGLATATESAALGALGAVLLAVAMGQFSFAMLRQVAHSTLVISTMIFAILLGATVFTLVFRGLGGEDVVIDLITLLPGGQVTAVIFVLSLIFLLGFIIDTFEIIFIVVPIFGPVLIMLGTDPIWLGVAMAIVLQTSYLTPPFGFAIFYLQGVGRGIEIETIYRGVIPFTLIQLTAVAVIWAFPELATWLPKVLF
ncbi:TRAP transporter, DctM subunit [Tistlia consotensis]|uniref:TRAP transporter large permease protein n=1 Tax=Tistlia consotensis USBA 355 TaxID=560819 RepID=A0A1Y6CET3_9PROT|nr:TRAP transporter large permease subunit [Tistlia consotensis]SMF48674.1 TRAP transporter, DctM subunit [Tistlia consotensis USBA 355]SNR80910.1 TRAP transporter, DctM subunit [Tistlia consotensis]